MIDEHDSTTPLWRLRDTHTPTASSSLKDVSVVALDLETTGRSAAHGHRITEVAIIGRAMDHYQIFVDPDASENRAFSSIYQDIIDRIEGRLVVGHNLSFDFEFLAREFERIDDIVLPCVTYVDTLSLARRELTNCHKFTLIAVAKHLDIIPEGPLHTASVDATVALEIFETLTARIQPQNLADLGLQRLLWQGVTS